MRSISSGQVFWRPLTRGFDGFCPVPVVRLDVLSLLSHTTFSVSSISSQLLKSCFNNSISQAALCLFV